MHSKNEIEDVPVEDWRIFGEIMAELFGEVDKLFNDGATHLFYGVSTYSKVGSLSSLAHVCNLLELIRVAADESQEPTISTLLTRQLVETYGVGVCLLLGGGPSAEKYLGNAKRMHEKAIAEREVMIVEGVIPPDSPEIPAETAFDGIATAKWNFTQSLMDAGKLLNDHDLTVGGLHLSGQLYGPLSNRLGAHPTPYVLDRYFTLPGLTTRFARIPEFKGSNFESPIEVKLNFIRSLLLSLIFTRATVHHFGLDTFEVDNLLTKFSELTANAADRRRRSTT